MKRNFKFFVTIFAAIFAMAILTTNKAEAQTKGEDDALSTWIGTDGDRTLTLKFYDEGLATLRYKVTDTLVMTYKGNSKAKSGPILLYYKDMQFGGVIEKDSNGYYMNLYIDGGVKYYRQ